MAQHKDLTGTDLHELKGMAAASGGAGDVGKVAASNGAGGSTVRKLTPTEVGIVEHYGQLTISNNAVVTAVTAAVDSTLSTNTDYIQVSSEFDTIPHGINVGVTQQTDSLTATVAGDYRVDLWVDSASSINSTTIAFKFAVNGTISLTRRPKNFMRNAGEFHNSGAFGFVTLAVGQIVTLHMASDNTANITLEDAVFDMVLLRAT